MNTDKMRNREQILEDFEGAISGEMEKEKSQARILLEVMLDTRDLLKIFILQTRDSTDRV